MISKSSLVFLVNTSIILINLLLNTSCFYGKSKLVFVISKILIVPLIAFINKPKTINFYVVFLLFSWLGDIALLFRHELFCVVGSLFFLVGHLYYAKFISPHSLKITTFSVILFIPPLSIILFKVIPDIFKAKFIYHLSIFYIAILLRTMLKSTQIYQHSSPFNRNFWFNYIGYFCFIVSDSILLVNEALQKMNGMVNFYVLLFYALSQFLIALSQK